MTSKTRNIISWILTGLVALINLGAGTFKLMANSEMLANVAKMGISPHKLKYIAFIQIISTVLFIIPRTGVLGALLLAAYFGGAIATHVEHFIPVTAPTIVECLIFITAAVRFPELTKRLRGIV